ncbi:MAG: photosystem II biosynthesis protein [Phormidesmis sp.]
MDSKSERDSTNGRGSEQSGNRAALPFEPKRKREKDAAKESESSQSSKDDRKKKAKKSESKSKDKNSETSAVSAKAQARVDDIRAANRKRAEKTQAQKKNEKNDGPDSDGRIPKEVSRRMVRRMAILSISPIAAGVSIFFLSYYLLSQQIVTFAPIVTLLTTMGCFGLGVLGLTYGMLSASWDEEPGSFVGFDEFKLNFGRIMDARKASKGT